MPDILHVQHNFFEIFLSVLSFQREIYTFFKSAQKLVLLPKKNDYHFLVGEGQIKQLFFDTKCVDEKYSH